MKKFTFYLAVGFLLLFINPLYALEGTIKIVVLGSSTAAGTGPSDVNNAWVNRYRGYVKAVNSSNEVVNLAIGGYTTYHIMPDGSTPPDGRPSPNSDHNITKALSLNPDVIIINLPTNDAANSIPVSEQIANYRTILAKAAGQNVPVWIATTQPRYFSGVSQTELLVAMRDSTYKLAGDKAIDFWTDIATDQGTIKPIFDMGDGVHLNDSAHAILASRVEATKILDYSKTTDGKDTINIDFGTNLSTGAWNNLDNAPADTVQNLINTRSQNTGIKVWVHDAFTGVNTTGTTSPDASLNLPSTATSDSFFGSEGSHGGIVEPTGGITLSGLDRNSTYSFSIFASRNGVTDNRETKYVVTGKSEQTVYLNPSNNSATAVVVNDLAPADNGTITIVASPGPNNNNATKYYFLGAIRITSVKNEVQYDKDGTVFIDLGSKLSTGTWNNMTSATGGETLEDMVNSEGNSTGMSAWVHDGFTGINETGTTSPDASLNFGSNATSDSFFGNAGTFSGVIEPTGGVAIGGLSQNSIYSFTFFASRTGVTDNREAQYKVTGATSETVYLDASNNTSNVVTVNDMVPADNGTITIDVAPGPNNTNTTKFFYLGVIKIDYKEKGTSASITGDDKNAGLRIYPNPVQGSATFEYNLPEPGETTVSIYSVSGQLVRIFSTGQQTGGKQQIQWDGTDGSGIKCKSGLYVCRMNVVTGNQAYHETRKFIIQ